LTVIMAESTIHPFARSAPGAGAEGGDELFDEECRVKRVAAVAGHARHSE
jgi:hypothetical protein